MERDGPVPLGVAGSVGVLGPPLGAGMRARAVETPPPRGG